MKVIFKTFSDGYKLLRIVKKLKLGRHIALLNNMKIEQIGTKEELLFNPASDFIKEFIGLKGYKSILAEK